MKRRDFLTQSFLLTGLSIPTFVRGQTIPCPPVLHGANGAQSTCGNVQEGDAEADWILRTSGPSVVWYHDFRSDAEVDAFRWTSGYGGGNDPDAQGSGGSQISRITTDGITGGGCLQILHLDGTEDGMHWWRPLAPMSAPGNGKAADDPAASGSLTVRAWNPTDGGGQTNAFDQGWYGHVSTQTAEFDGDEFWLQMRVKRDPRRVQGSNQSITVGKHQFLSVCAASLVNQDLITYSNGGGGVGVNQFRIYGGWQVFAPLDDAPDAPDGTIQPGGVTPIWEWNSGSWDTVMYHLVVGREGISETLIEVYGAHEGETEFTKFWDQTFAVGDFEIRPGLQAIILSTYNNDANMTEFYELWDQLIFSHDFIPCPGAIPAYILEMPRSSINHLSSVSGSYNNWKSLLLAETEYGGDSAADDNGMHDYSGGIALSNLRKVAYNGGGHSSPEATFNGLVIFDYNGTAQPVGFELAPNSTSLLADVVDGDTYLDGKPGGVHSYAGMQFDPFDQTVYRFSGAAHPLPGTTKLWGYSLITEEWTDYGSYGGSYDASIIALFDPATRKLLCMIGGVLQYRVFDCATKQWLGSVGAVSNPSPSIHVTATWMSPHGWAYVICGNGGSQPLEIRLDWNTSTDAIETTNYVGVTTGDTGIIQSTYGPATCYDEVNDCLWSYDPNSHGTSLFHFNPTTKVWTEYALTGTGLNPSAQYRGNYGRLVNLDGCGGLGTFGRRPNNAIVIRKPEGFT